MAAATTITTMAMTNAQYAIRSGREAIGSIERSRLLWNPA